MRKRPLIGIKRHMIPIPRFLWERQVRDRARAAEGRLKFMTEDHHRVRDFVVREIPAAGGPLSPELIAERLGLSLEKTIRILDELEKRLFFLFRNEAGAVTWAYPATADSTPHEALMNAGERVHAA
jgi:hypothetical protein